jgi:hypothetical protein
MAFISKLSSKAEIGYWRDMQRLEGRIHARMP